MQKREMESKERKPMADRVADRRVLSIQEAWVDTHRENGQRMRFHP